MDRRKHPERPPWPAWRRLAHWLYGFLIGPFLTKLRDGTVMGSMTRWAVAAFTAAEVYRLVHLPIGQATWAEAFLAFCILFALPIDGALSTAPAEKVLEAVTGMFGRGGQGGGYFSQSSSWATASGWGPLDDADPSRIAPPPEPPDA